MGKKSINKLHKSIPITRDELLWASGLFEGEGCISHNGKSNNRNQVPKLIMCSTDIDVIARFWDAIGRIGKFRLRGTKPSVHHKDAYEWRVIGFEGTQAVIAMLWAGLSIRRKSRAREILSGKF